MTPQETQTWGRKQRDKEKANKNLPKVKLLPHVVRHRHWNEDSVQWGTAMGTIS